RTERRPRAKRRCRYHAHALTISASTARAGSKVLNRKPSYCPRDPRPIAAPSDPSAGKQPAQERGATSDRKLLVLLSTRVTLMLLPSLGEIVCAAPNSQVKPNCSA